MTDQKDYLRLPEVLEACGVESKNGINVGEGLTIYPILTTFLHPEKEKPCNS